MKRCIVIGASHAGSQAAISLRQSGWDGEIVLIGDETDLPYHRPPLSKDYMSGDKSLGDILLRPETVYKTANITLKLGIRIVSIDNCKKQVETSAGNTLSFDKLILATGARVRKIPIDGADLPGVYYLRDAADARAISEQIWPDKRAVIIGGGYIGLETAASLRKQGMAVTVLEAAERILQRVTAQIMSDFYRRIHTEEGVAIVEGAIADRIEHSDDGLTVLTKDGQSFSCDCVVVGIGVIPNVELARDAGLDVGNGIVVNEFCQTSNEDIYAIGDVTWHHNPIYDTHLRLESVPNATEQAKIAALHIMDKPKAYNSLPWFWSDQFDLKLQIAGLSTGYDDIVLRGSTEEGRQFAAFYFKGERLLAVDAVNDPRSFMFARMAISKGQILDKIALANSDIGLKEAVVK